MTSRTRRAARTGLLTLLTTAALASGLVGPASYADGETEAPVAVDDSYTWFTGGGNTLDVLANDSDPQGADLAVCKVKGDPGDYTIGGAQLLDGEVYAFTSPDPAGPLVFRYYACNDEFLTPATVTIDFKVADELRVHKIADEPGHLSIRNPNDQRVVLLYGNQHFFGYRRVAAHTTRDIKVPVRNFQWFGLIGRENGFAGHGRIHDLRVPDSGKPAQPEVSRRLRGLWDARR